MIKAVILVGGPVKGTRFRPLSFDLPKPLFPVAGFPILHHHLEACSQIPDLTEILIIGFYQPSDVIRKFLNDSQLEFHVQIRYLQEYTALGTAGGIYHFRDQILTGNPSLFFVLYADVCGDFPLLEMLTFHRQRAPQAQGIVLGTEATRQQSRSYGCVVEDKDTHEILHYVERPETFVSSTINCGVYLFSPAILKTLEVACKKRLEKNFHCRTRSSGVLCLQQDLLVPLAGTGALFMYLTSQFWSQIKSASAAVYANRHYLASYHLSHPDYLAKNRPGSPIVLGDVFIHPTAVVHPTAVLGPNVTIGRDATVAAGARVRETIVLEGALLEAHCCVLYSIVGWHSTVGAWARVEGTPDDPNPNKPFAKLELQSMCSSEGKLNPSITVI
ncbi:unnamed protein product, partial [Candidula unifasciata]